MTEYPILVGQYDEEHLGDITICTGCGLEEEWNSEHGDPEDWGARCEGCNARLAFKYQEADRCPNCKELGYWSSLPLKGCCSRICMLQWEYVETLQALERDK